MTFKLFEKGYTARERQADARTIFSTPEGKRILKHLEHSCGANRSNSPYLLTDSQISYSEGKRAIYLEIRKLLTEQTIKEVEDDRSYNTGSTTSTGSQRKHPDPTRRNR